MVINRKPSVTIVVLNWNNFSDTAVCLESLGAVTYPNFNVVVVDNASTDDSTIRLRGLSFSYPFVLIENDSNLGYAAGNNVGIRYALEIGASKILLLNNDTVVARDFLDRLCDCAERFPSAGIISARLFYLGDPTRVWFDGARWSAEHIRLEWPGQGMLESELPNEDHETDYASGAALLFRAEVAEKIGLLDEAFFLVWEEVDWCFRARAVGWTIVVATGAKVWHKIGASFGDESSPLRTYFSVRNEMLWFRRHASLDARSRLFVKNIRRLVPKFSLANGNEFLGKRLLWAVIDVVKSFAGQGSRLEYLAVRQAIFDYANGRLGDCPDKVRLWSQTWADGKKTRSRCEPGIKKK